MDDVCNQQIKIERRLLICGLEVRIECNYTMLIVL